jgi:hypothetical protein
MAASITVASAPESRYQGIRLLPAPLKVAGRESEHFAASRETTTPPGRKQNSGEKQSDTHRLVGIAIHPAG